MPPRAQLRRQLSRRNFCAPLSRHSTPGQSDTNKMIGMQIGAVSFVDEGVEQVLEILKPKAR